MLSAIGQATGDDFQRAQIAVRLQLRSKYALDRDEIDAAIAKLDAMQLRDTRHRSLHVHDAVAIEIPQHYQRARSTLRDVDRAVVRHREHARIVEPFGKSVDVKSGGE